MEAYAPSASASTLRRVLLLRAGDRKLIERLAEAATRDSPEMQAAVVVFVVVHVKDVASFGVPEEGGRERVELPAAPGRWYLPVGTAGEFVGKLSVPNCPTKRPESVKCRNWLASQSI